MGGDRHSDFDSKQPTGDIHEFLMGEVRYNSLVLNFPEEAERLHKQLIEDFKARYERLKAMAEEKSEVTAEVN